MNYAVILTGGKQYKVEAGQVLEVENLHSEPQTDVVFDKVLLVVNDSSLQVGKPYIEGATVSAKVLENFKGDKIRVSKFKAKSRYRRTTGHRQMLTKIQIDQISEKGKKTTKS